MGADPTADGAEAVTAGAPPGQRFFGWWVVAGAFVLLLTSAGLGFYGLPLYLSTLNEERGFSVSAMSGATAVFFLTTGASGVGLARLLRRVDPRPLIVVGAAVVAGALVALGRVTALWHVYAVYVLFGLGYSFTSLVISNTVVTRWFHRRRSVALSIASTGLSVGGIVLTPVAEHLIDDRGLRGATPLLAVVYAAGCTVVPLLLLRPDPARLGQHPDGGPPPSATVTPTVTPTGHAPGMRYEEVVRTVLFVTITAGFLVSLMGQVGGISQLVKLATERADEVAAERAVSVLALCSVLGRLLGGVLLTRVSSRAFAVGCMAVQGAGLALLASADGRWPVLASAALFGLAVGNVLLLHPLLLAEAFGVRDYARIYSRSQFVVMVGIAGGPFLLGWLRDHAGGYATAYLVAAALSALGAVVYGAGSRHVPV